MLQSNQRHYINLHMSEPRAFVNVSLFQTEKVTRLYVILSVYKL